MSAEKIAEKPRRYVEFRYVTLLNAVDAPPRYISTSNFSGEAYRFFIHEGFFCIECRKSGEVIDVPPAQIRARRWPKQEAWS